MPVRNLKGDDCPLVWDQRTRTVAARQRRPDGVLEEVGHVRVWVADACAELADLFVSPAARGRGIGTRLVAAAAAACEERWPQIPLLARVARGNAASLRAFAVSGFAVREDRGEHLILVRPAGARPNTRQWGPSGVRGPRRRWRR